MARWSSDAGTDVADTVGVATVLDVVLDDTGAALVPVDAAVGVGVGPWVQLARNAAPKVRMHSRRRVL
jgi:hypothetical protein